jgi:hypothetical protein
MKKLLTILTVTALLGAVGTADAGFKAGTYKGTTKWDKPMSFTATKSEVSAFKIKVRYGCTDFDTFTIREKGFPAIAIDDEGKFGARFTNEDGSYTAKIKGTLSGKTAKGSFLAKRTYNGRDELDPNGSITCEVPKMSWSAKKQS